MYQTVLQTHHTGAYPMPVVSDNMGLNIGYAFVNRLLRFLKYGFTTSMRQFLCLEYKL